MYILLALGAIFTPLLMFILRRRTYAFLFDLLAAIAFLLANISAGLSVLDIKLTHTEFTTHIHEIFTDWLFLAALGYLSIYAVYRLMVTTMHTWNNRTPA